MLAVIEQMQDLPAGSVGDLVAESEQAGLRFVRRLVEEWASGANRFDRPGEALFGASWNGRLVGVCGLNVDPYAGDERIGRLRHLYVLIEARRHGVGRELVTHIFQAARGRFDQVHLRTDNPAAARLYESLGFRRCAGPGDNTHAVTLAAASPGLAAPLIPSGQPRPEESMFLSNYLFFTTTCEQALEFYTRCGLGKVVTAMRWGDGGMPVRSEAMRGKIMHAQFEGPGVRFFASDNDDAEPMRGSAMIFWLEDREQTEQLFARLADGGRVTTPLAVQPWGDYFGKLTDRFGVQWMFNCTARA